MEFMEKCCFVFPLRTGAVVLDLVVSGLCITNIIYTVTKIIYNGNFRAAKMVYVAIFVIMNIAICCLVQFMTYYSTRGYISKWYIGFSFFVFVLCQMMAIVIVLTEFVTVEPMVAVAVTMLILTAVLFYFVLVIVSILYQNGEQVRIEEEMRLRASSIHLNSAGDMKKKYMIPLEPSQDTSEEELVNRF